MSSANIVEPIQLLAFAREDLACYSIAQWHQFELARHHDLTISKLEAVERGEIKRLIICLPPRHGKSFLTSSIFPAWFLGRHPERHVIFVTYGQEFSDDFGRRVRNFMVDPVHQAIFPDCKLSEDSTAAHRFNTTANGAYFAVGRGGPITGRGADLLLIDDPIKDREEANSETVRKSLHEWFASVAYPRLMPGGAIIIIQTRWHEDDLAGWLLREHASENWDVVSLPAIAEQDERFRKEGEAALARTIHVGGVEPNPRSHWQRRLGISLSTTASCSRRRYFQADMVAILSSSARVFSSHSELGYGVQERG